MATTRVIRYEVIETLVPTGSTSLQFNFPDQPQLRDARIVGMEIYAPGVMTLSPLSGTVPVALADLQKTSLTLMVGNLQQVDKMPVLALNRFTDAVPTPYIRDMQLFNDLVVSWTKSFFSVPTALGTTGRAYVIGVYYYIPSGDLQNRS